MQHTHRVLDKFQATAFVSALAQRNQVIDVERSSMRLVCGHCVLACGCEVSVFGFNLKLGAVTCAFMGKSSIGEVPR